MSPRRPGMNVWWNSSEAAYVTAPRKAIIAALERIRGEGVDAIARASRNAKPAYSNPWRALSPTRARASSPGAGTGWDERAKMMAAYAIAAVQRKAALQVSIRVLERAQLVSACRCPRLLATPRLVLRRLV